MSIFTTKFVMIRIDDNTNRIFASSDKKKSMVLKKIEDGFIIVHKDKECKLKTTATANEVLTRINRQFSIWQVEKLFQNFF